VPRGMCQETYSNGDLKYWSEYNTEVSCINGTRELKTEISVILYFV